MFESIINFFKKIRKQETESVKSKDAAKERLHLVLMQDRANVSADFLDLMKQEIIEVIKKYIDVDENAIDVRLTNKSNDDGTTGAPALYANIPIVSIKDDVKAGMARQKEEKPEQTTQTNADESVGATSSRPENDGIKPEQNTQSNANDVGASIARPQNDEIKPEQNEQPKPQENQNKENQEQPSN